MQFHICFDIRFAKLIAPFTKYSITTYNVTFCLNLPRNLIMYGRFYAGACMTSKRSRCSYVLQNTTEKCINSQTIMGWLNKYCINIFWNYYDLLIKRCHYNREICDSTLQRANISMNYYNRNTYNLYIQESICYYVNCHFISIDT